MPFVPAVERRLVALMRLAGKSDQFEVKIPLDDRYFDDKEVKEFVNHILWNFNLNELKRILRVAFGESENPFDEHNLSQEGPPCCLVVYNMKKKPSDSNPPL